MLCWVYVTTVPLTLLTLLTAAAAWSTTGRRRSWHLAAVVIVSIERLATFSYFITTMVTLMASDGVRLAALRALSMGPKSDAAGS